MMTELKLHTYGEKLIVSEKVTIASGDINSAAIAVEFDECWDNYPARTAIFKNDKVTGNIEVLMVDNKCTIPAEVIQKNGTLKISIRAVSLDGTALKTSTKIRYTIAEGASPGTTTLTPTMDLYQQYLAAMHEKAEPLFDAYKKQMDAEYAAKHAQMTTENAQFRAALLELLEPKTLWENTDLRDGNDWNSERKISVNLSGFKHFVVFFLAEEYETESPVAFIWTEKNKTHTASTHVLDDDKIIMYRDCMLENDGLTVGKLYDSTPNIHDGSGADHLIPHKIIGYTPIIDE